MEPVSSNSENRCLPFEFKEVTDEFQLKAEKELNETQERRIKSLTKIKEGLKREKHLLSDTRDEFLIQFLRARKFDPNAALKLVTNYYKHRRNYPSLYQRYNPKYCMDILESNFFNYLPMRSPEGCSVLIVKVGNWDPAAITASEVVKFAHICHTMDLFNPVTQISGIMALVDLKGLSSAHLLAMSLSEIYCLVSVLQDALPMRLKAVHILNNPKIFSMIFSVIKPLLKNKMKKRMYFHGNNFNSLHEYLPASILPTEYGGTQTEAIPNGQFLKTLLDNGDLIEAYQEFGYVR